MKNILYIGNKLSKHGFSVTSIETLGELLEKNNYKVFYASEKLNPIYRLLDMIFKTIKYRNKIEFVIIDTYSTSNFYYAFIISQLCRLLKLKYIPCLRGGNLINRIESSKVLCNLIFKNSYINIAPSKYFFEYFNSKGLKVKLIPNFIQIDNYPFLERENPQSRILWVRSLQDIYNPKMAIDVIEILTQEFSEATLCMVGQEKNVTIKELKAYATNKNIKVEFTGKLSKSEWVNLSKKYDVFINTTNFDNTPISVIEAMALGLAVVSTNAGGIPSLFSDKENIMLCDKGDSKKMSYLISNLIKNKTEHKRITKNARSFVENFDAKQVINLWNETIN